MSGKKTAIITGASGGIGAGLVEGFLREGYNVVATSREASRKLTASGSLILVDGDIGTQQTAGYAVEAAINNFGIIDVLVNNAGIFLNQALHRLHHRGLRGPYLHQSFWILLHYSAHGQRDAETEIGVRCEHHRGACRSANRRKQWLDFDDYKGRVEFSDAESRNRVCQRRHPL